MKELIDFIASVMEVDPETLSEDTAYGQHEKWDSMMQLRLVMEIEEEYDVEIPIDDVPNIKTLKDFYKYIDVRYYAMHHSFTNRFTCGGKRRNRSCRVV